MDDTPRWITFEDLPVSSGGFSELFRNYLHNYSEVQSFFPRNFRNPADFEAVMGLIQQHQPDRKTLVSVLQEQNKAWGSEQRTFENISLLEHPDTYAVVTGQQVGLFGGPLYTVFKTLTAIKLARTLKARYPDKQFVPVFWVEGEDHDFAEMNNVSVLDTEGKPAKIEYLPGGMMPEKNPGPVGEMQFDATMDQTFDQLTKALQKTEFTDALLQRLRECYAAGRTFNQAFTGWMNVLFKEFGLVFLSSNHPRLKALLSPIFIKELTEYPRVSQIVIGQSAELEQRYHAQIKAKSINLFMFHKGGRYLIEPREHDFSLKGTRHFLDRDELLQIATNTPEMLSPNVVLRPIAQDTLLPTVSYIAGPGEVAYYAQLRPVYEYFGTPQPVLYPRASASFVEEKVERVVEKYSLDIMEFFQDKDKLMAKVVTQISEVKLDDIFGRTDQFVSDALNELKFGLNEVDPTLLGTLENVREKMSTNINVLREKALAAQKRRNETALRQVEKAMAALFPGGSLQERDLNIVYYLNKYGPEIVKWLNRELDIEGFRHQLLRL